MWRAVAFFLILLCIAPCVFPQDAFTDSINKLYANEKNDTAKLSCLRQIAAHYQSLGDYRKAQEYYTRITNASSDRYPERALDAENEMAFGFIQEEEYDKADSLLDQVLQECNKRKYLKGLGFAYRYSGLKAVYQGDYKTSTDFYVKALGIWETLSDPFRIAMGNSDLGLNFYYQENYKKAANYWEDAIRIMPNKNSDYYINNCSNLGQAYVELEMYDKATEYFIKARDYHAKNRRSSNYTNALTGLANVAYKQKYYNKALDYYKEIIRLREAFNARSSDLATTYLNISLIYSEMNQNREALEYGIKGYVKALESGDKSELLHAYNNLNSVYARNKNFEKAYEFSQLYNTLRDSLNGLESQKQIIELDKKYQTEKKEKDNQLLNKQLEIQQIQGKQQKLYLIISVVVLILIGFSAAILFRQNKQKQEANKQLSEKNKIIEEQHKDITDSIKYAQRIQEAILPPAKMWKELLPQSFVLYRPKDILSGDFYWIEQVGEKIMIAAADCTGHGVPGALMSIVNLNLLNKAVLENNKAVPSTFLDTVNQWLTITLHQSFNESAVRDGMDISLCSLDKKSRQMQFAGAFNGVYIFKKDGTLLEVKGDKMPVGAFIEDKVQLFSNHVLQLEKDDRVFIFSDGYADQFGGPKGKKLKYKKLQEYIRESLHLSMAEQKDYLDQKFIDWKGRYEQVDDVLIVGFSV